MNKFILDRRGAVGAMLSLGLLSGCASAAGRRHPLSRDPFSLGVAAGDPAPDGFVIWTRLAPDLLADNGGMPAFAVPLGWELAADPQFRTIVQSGTAEALAENAHTVHVELAGLRPHRPYWYRFHAAGGAVSDIGCARTLPAPGAQVERIRIASVGCQDYESGFYTAFAHLAREEAIDAVFHYGDYIYEFGRRAKNPLRRHSGPETMALADYRRRYAQYKADPDLRAAHAGAAFIPSFDDHEIVDNWAGDHGKDGDQRGFAARKAAALKAWYEHMPVRDALRPGPATRYFRRFDFGDLVRMHVLDTRSHRSVQLCEPRRDGCVPAYDPARTMLGDAQERWLGSGLSGGSRWNFIAQQVQMMPFDVRRDGATQAVRSTDNWNGYPHARQRVIDMIAERRLTNVVVGSGDMHQHVVGSIPRDPDDAEGPAIASEFLASSITSGGSGSPRHSFQQDALRHNPNVALLNNQRGYQLYDISRELWSASIAVIDQIDHPGGRKTELAKFVVEHDRPGPLRT